VQIVALLRDYSRTPAPDVQTFLDAIAFNWLIAGTDAHSKNYSVLIGAGGNVRLAPLYDLASILPYTDMNLQKAKLAMKIGGEHLLRNIRLYHWKKMAAELRLDPEVLIHRVDDFGRQLTELAEKIRQQLFKAGLEHKILGRLTETIAERSTSAERFSARHSPVPTRWTWARCGKKRSTKSKKCENRSKSLNQWHKPGKAMQFFWYQIVAYARLKLFKLARTRKLLDRAPSRMSKLRHYFSQERFPPATLSPLTPERFRGLMQFLVKDDCFEASARTKSTSTLLRPSKVGPPP